MNIHPIFVHFPIALFTIYAVMEILQFKVLRESRVWNIIKAVFVILGTLTSFLALQTGDGAEHIMGHTSLVETHSNFAGISVWLFAAISIIYIVRMINTESATIKDWCWNTKYVRNIWNILSRITDFLFKYWGILVVIGIIGLVLITITGSLGGAIVYGPDADPVVSFIYHLFF